MTDTPLYECFAKVRFKDGAEPSIPYNWMVGRRGWFMVFEDRVECGSWRIPLSDVRQATLYRFDQLSVRGTIIELDTAHGQYHFSFDSWASPADHIALDFQEKEFSFTCSTFSWILCVLALIGVALSVWYFFLR